MTLPLIDTWSIIVPCTAFNLVKNSGPYDTAPFGWTLAGGATVNIGATNGPVKFGNNSFFLSGTNSQTFQTIANVAPVTTYRCSAYFYLLSGTCNLRAQDGTVTVTNPSTKTGVWQRIELNFTTAASSPTLLIVAYTSGATDKCYVTGFQVEILDTANLLINPAPDQWTGSPLAASNWVASPTSLVTRSFAQLFSPVDGSAHSFAAALVTGAASPTTFYQAVTTTPGVNYIASGNFWVTGTITFSIIDAGSSVVLATTTLTGTGTSWQSPNALVFVALSASTRWQVTAATSAGNNVYVNLAYMQTAHSIYGYSNAATTYMDPFQIGCQGRNTNSPANCVTDRTNNTRLGGRIMNVGTFNTVTVSEGGFAYPEVSNLGEDFAVVDGGLWENAFLKPRLMEIDWKIGAVDPISQPTGITMQGLAASREALKDALKFDLVPQRQEFLLQFNGWSVNASGNAPASIPWMEPKYIKGSIGALGGVGGSSRAAHGLAGEVNTANNGYTELIKFRILSMDPFWYSYGYNAQNLYSSATTLTPSNILGNFTGNWSTLSGGTNGAVNCICGPDTSGNIFIGGTFSQVNMGGTPLSAANVASFNIYTLTWSNLGTGLVGTGGGFGPVCNDMALDANNNLYLIGAWTTSNGVTTNSIAKWNGTTFVALGSGLTTTKQGNALYYEHSSGYLHVAGTFTAAGGNACGGHAVWKTLTSAWLIQSVSGASGGALGYITSICAYPSNVSPGPVVLAGGFGSFNGTSCAAICVWDGTNVTNTMGNAITGARQVYETVILGPDSFIYAGGGFDTIGGIPNTSLIAQWRGSAWYPLGKGLKMSSGGAAYVYALSFDAAGMLHAGGLFDTQTNFSGATTTVNSYARWSSGAWTFPDIQFGASNAVFSIMTSPINGGIFMLATNGNTQAIAFSNITNVTINGSALAYPRFVFVGPGTLESLKNTSSGATINFNSFVINVGEQLTLDLNPLGASFSSSAASRGDLSSVIQNSDTSQWFLLPNRTNVISCYIDGATTAATTAIMIWNDRWDSADGGAY